jgi:hypothetical protein
MYVCGNVCMYVCTVCMYVYKGLGYQIKGTDRKVLPQGVVRLVVYDTLTCLSLIRSELG